MFNHVNIKTLKCSIKYFFYFKILICYYISIHWYCFKMLFVFLNNNYLYCSVYQLKESWICHRFGSRTEEPSAASNYSISRLQQRTISRVHPASRRSKSNLPSVPPWAFAKWKVNPERVALHLALLQVPELLLLLLHLYLATLSMTSSLGAGVSKGILKATLPTTATNTLLLRLDRHRGTQELADTNINIEDRTVLMNKRLLMGTCMTSTILFSKITIILYFVEICVSPYWHVFPFVIPYVCLRTKIGFTIFLRNKAHITL